MGLRRITAKGWVNATITKDDVILHDVRYWKFLLRVSSEMNEKYELTPR
jgi:hypothetical protein